MFNHYKVFIAVASKIIWWEQLFNRQKIHFPSISAIVVAVKIKGWVGFHITAKTFSLVTFFQRLPWAVTVFFFCLSSQFNFHSLFLQGLLMRTLFYSGFSCNKPLVWGSCCRDWYGFSIMYIFVNKLNNVSNFAFNCKKKKEKEIKYLEIILLIFFPILRNKTKLMTKLDFVFPCRKYKWPFG